MSKKYQGSCLCGSVAYTISGPFNGFHWCHCSRCRKDTGSSHASNIFGLPDSLEWSRGDDLVKRFDLPGAKRYAKAFCTNCGSPVPYLNRTGTSLIIPAGTLDTDPGVLPEDNIFWESRAVWYEAGITAERFPEGPQD